MPSSKKDHVYEAAALLTRQWNQMLVPYLPLKPNNHPPVSVILAAIASPLDVLVRLMQADEEPAHQVWEYQIIDEPGTSSSLVATLTKLGDEGWELCGIDYGCFILKRPKQ